MEVMAKGFSKAEGAREKAEMESAEPLTKLPPRLLSTTLEE